MDRSEYLKAVDRSEVRVVRCAPLAELFKKVPLSHSTRRLTGESTSHIFLARGRHHCGRDVGTNRQPGGIVA